MNSCKVNIEKNLFKVLNNSIIDFKNLKFSNEF